MEVPLHSHLVQIAEHLHPLVYQRDDVAMTEWCLVALAYSHLVYPCAIHGCVSQGLATSPLASIEDEMNA